MKASNNWVLVTTILASKLSFIDGSVVNVGLPAMYDQRLFSVTWRVIAARWRIG